MIAYASPAEISIVIVFAVVAIGFGLLGWLHRTDEAHLDHLEDQLARRRPLPPTGTVRVIHARPVREDARGRTPGDFRRNQRTPEL